MNLKKEPLNSQILSEKNFKIRKIIYGLLALILVILVVVCVSLFFLLPNEESCLPTQRWTTHGPVIGTENTTVLGQKYYAFWGIPYAAPPITGIDPYTKEWVDRRFKAPEPLNYNWTEPLKVHSMKCLCQVTEILSVAFAQYIFDEDCLFVNVFIPAGGAEKKTTLVYIHGAGIDGGTESDILLGPDFFLSQDNVVVHIEYRVQMYGFLNLGFGDYTGNMGLKDQQLGLKWVYENIENFSGNKDEIMIFGGSLGGTFVHAHTLNSESRKYFNRALSSGGVISFLNLPIQNNLAYLQACLQTKKTGDELVEYMKVVDSYTLKECSPFDWSLSIENPNNPGAFLTKTPKEIYMTEKVQPIDIMYITASQESIQFAPPIIIWYMPLTEMDWMRNSPVLLYNNFSGYTYPIEYERALDVLRESYFSNVRNVLDIRDANIDYLSDKVIRDNMLSAIMLQVNVNNNSTNKTQHKNTFLLKYSTHSDLNLMDTKEHLNYTEAVHSDDLCYYFYCLFSVLHPLYEKHLKNKDKVYDMIMYWTKMITNFARYGDPSIEGDTPFKSCRSSDEIYCQVIGNETKSRRITDVKKQFHYDTWREIDSIYNNLNTSWQSFY